MKFRRCKRKIPYQDDDHVITRSTFHLARSIDALAMLDNGRDVHPDTHEPWVPSAIPWMTDARGECAMAEIRSATVYFQLPVWVIGSPSAHVKEIVRAVDPHGVNGVLLFTRKSLAQRHLVADSRLAGKVLWMVFDQWHFFGLLVLLEKSGTEYFVIDPVPALTGTSMSVRHAVPIAGLRAYVEQLVL